MRNSYRVKFHLIGVSLLSACLRCKSLVEFLDKVSMDNAIALKMYQAFSDAAENRDLSHVQYRDCKKTHRIPRLAQLANKRGGKDIDEPLREIQLVRGKETLARITR